MQIVKLHSGKAVVVDKGIVIELVREEAGDAIRVVNASGETLTFVFSSEFENGLFHDLPEGADEKVLIKLTERADEPEAPEEEELTN